MTRLALWQRLGNLFRDGIRKRTMPSRRTLLTVEQLEDRLAPAAVNFAVTQDWGSGFQASLTIANAASASPVTNWQLEFNYSANITSIWDAKIVSHVGTDYVDRQRRLEQHHRPRRQCVLRLRRQPRQHHRPADELLARWRFPLAVPQPPPPPPPPPASGNVTFSVTTDWGSGFNGQVTVSNPGTTPITNWSLAFTFAGQISSIWNASITSHTGNQYVVQNASWNGTIPGGGSVSFGFTASPGGGAVTLTNFVLNGTGGTGRRHHQPATGGRQRLGHNPTRRPCRDRCPGQRHRSRRRHAFCCFVRPGPARHGHREQQRHPDLHPGERASPAAIRSPIPSATATAAPPTPPLP